MDHMMKKYRSGPALVLSVLLAMAMLAGCGAKPEPAAEEEPPAALETAAAEETAMQTEAPAQPAEENNAAPTEETGAASTGETGAAPAASGTLSSNMASGEASRGMNGGGHGFGGINKSADTALQEMIAQVVGKYQVFTYEDSQAGRSLEYNLYIPEDYDPAQQYPMVLFMGDSTTTGRGAEYQLTQGWGGIIWATAEEQAKHPCFVVVPAATETLANDDWSTSVEADMIARLVMELEETYSIDKNRVYTTGQSGGCMTSMYLNITYPGLFAASLYVSGQWDAQALRTVEDTKFFYVTAEGDQKASGGKAELQAVLDEDGVPYASVTMDAQAGEETWNADIARLLAQNCDKNMVQWKKGSVQGLEGDSVNTIGEHMASFDFAYKVPAIRDWLFAQSN